MKIKLYISISICLLIIGCANKEELSLENDVKEIIPETKEKSSYELHENIFYPLKESMEDIQYQINELKARVEGYESTLHAPTLNSELLKMIKSPQLEHELIMDNGTIIQGKIINESSDQIFIQTRIGQLKLDKAFIKSINNIDPLIPYLEFVNESLLEKKGDSNLIVSGNIANTGGRRGDFVRVIYKLWETDTNFLFSDSVFVSGNSIIYNNNVISDACIDPGEMGKFSLIINFPDSLNVTYWTKEIKYEIAE